MTMIYIRHIRKAGVCLSGARRWADAHGFKWRDFCQKGIDTENLIGIEDAFLTKIKDIADKESADGC